MYINDFFKVITITILIFLVERYVLLEPSLKEKKQKVFYIVCFISVLLTYIISFLIEKYTIYGEVVDDLPLYIALLFGALNIFFGREKHKLLAAIMVIPLIGIIDGLASPIFIVQFALNTFCNLSDNNIIVQLSILTIYILFFVSLILFYFKGKYWRLWFKENMSDRSTRLSEKILIIVSGLVIALFSSYVEIVLSEIDSSIEIVKNITTMAIFFEVIAFMTSLIIIVMIMQGNKRKFYHDRVSIMQFSVIATMADIVEDRDSNTGGHIKRTAKYVEIIGKYLLKKNEYSEVLTKQYLENMVVAAPLHDIGKISIPDAILNKPGRLTNEEFELMKKHTTAGRKALLRAENQMGKFDYLEIAMDMAEFHHEWFNGKGYPKSIKGNDIPLCARIMAVADVFDALTSKRCYKEAMPINKAFDIIESESNTHFDPIIVNAFLNCKDEIETAYNTILDE